MSSIENLMTRKVVSVEPDASILDVLNKLRAYRISCVVVCQDEVPIGIISERDIISIAYNLVAGHDEERERASDLMSPSLTTIQLSDSFEHAIEIVEAERIRHLPVVDDDGRLVGLLTQTDLLRAALHGSQ